MTRALIIILAIAAALYLLRRPRRTIAVPQDNITVPPAALSVTFENMLGEADAEQLRALRGDYDHLLD